MNYGQAPIGNILGGLLKNRHLVADMRRVMVLSLWERVVGELVAKKAWPEGVDDGVLTVAVTTHAWAQELDLLKPQILSRYRQLLGRNALRDVRFRVGRRRKSPEPAPAPIPPLHPTREERLSTEPVPGDLLSDIGNPEVRTLLGPVFARLRAARAWKQEHGWTRCPTCHRVHARAACPYCTPPDAA
jgi:predicted nucleic acid-binding Zn ribbon protein